MEAVTLTDEQRASFEQAIEGTLIDGHNLCGHFRAMRECINTFAGYRFNIDDSSIVWLMLFLEAVLMLPPEERLPFTVSMIDEMTKLTAAAKNLPRLIHEEDRSDLH